MARLVVLVGPIAAGKSSVANRLAELLTARGTTVVVVDVDDIAGMVRTPGAAAAGLWGAAHEAHGALAGQWMRSAVGIVVVVGPIYSREEQAALTRHMPPGTPALWVVIDAPVSVTFARAQDDRGRALSREHAFHHAAHGRFRELRPQIPADLSFDSAAMTAADSSAAIAAELG